MRKTRDIFKKTEGTKVIFHSKLGTIEDRKVKDLTEAEEIKRRWQEYIELDKKGLNDQDKLDTGDTHIEPDILEYKVKWPLGSITKIKAGGGELLKILKDDTLKVLPTPSRS